MTSGQSILSKPQPKHSRLKQFLFLTFKVELFLLLITVPCIAHADTTTGLVGWWKMDEGTGTSTTADSSGQGNTGALVNSPTWVTGNRQPYALSFNGSNQYVNINNFVVNSPALSVSFWFNTNDNVSVKRIVEQKWSLGAFTTNIGPAGYVSAVFNYTTGQGSSLNTPISANVWYHLVMVYDGSTEYLYLNGVQKNSANDAKTLKSATQPIFIGSMNFPFNGEIDDVRVYNRALSAQDVMTLYIGGNHFSNAHLGNFSGSN